MFGYANPTKFMTLTARLHLPVWGLALILLAVGLYLSFTAPQDYQQGETVRIMFLHVPAAWMALFGYSFVTFASIAGLVWRHPVGHFAAKAAAPIGAAFTLICLLTGSLWGKPMWGTWWVWDARLTSVLVLFFIYLGYMAVWQAIEEPLQAAKSAAVLAIVGFVNVPIVKFSVDWWNTLHQPASVSRLAAPAIHESLLTPLLVMSAAFMALFFALWLTRVQTEIWRQRNRARRMGLDDAPISQTNQPNIQGVDAREL